MNNLKQIKVVTVIGAGSWGTCIAKVIGESWNNITVKIWAYEKSVASSINNKKENLQYLPGIQLPKNIKAFSNLKESLFNANVVIIATPSKNVFDISQKISKLITRETHVGYLSKGFCKINHEVVTISQAIGIAIPFLKNRVIAIYGPSHAEEVSIKYHTCLNVAGTAKDSRKIIADLLSTDYLQCREIDDIIGVEVGGTLKNPAAIAAGMIAVLPKCGDNLAGALISEALKEMIQLGKIFNVKEETIIDISGLGDLVATALSDHSRNRRFGKDIATQIMKKGKSLNFLDKIILRFKPASIIERMSEKLHYLAEGAYAIEPLIELAASKNISIPVYRSLYEVLLHKKDPTLLIETIKNPEKFIEIYFNTKIHTTDRKRGLENINGIFFKDIIIQKTVDKFTVKKDSNENQSIDKNDLIDQIKKFTTLKSSNKEIILSKKELEIITALDEKNFDSSIYNLSSLYINTIIDNFNIVLNWLFIRCLKIIHFINTIFKQKGNISIVGSFNEIKKIKNSANAIYISNIVHIYDFIFILLSFNRKQMLFPRFLVDQRAVKNEWQKNLIKLIGGFIVDYQRLPNPVYKESLCQYLSTMIEHGVPLLYFFNNKTEHNDLAENEFFRIITESLYKHTVEIVLIPIKISYKQFYYDKKMSLFKLFMNDLDINFSEPVFLSDYTKQPYNIVRLYDTIRSIWTNH